jgi:hypothetical protein
VLVVFNELLESTSAVDVFRYSINEGATVVISAILNSDGRSVVLTTEPLADGVFYVLAVNGVTDLAGIPALERILITLQSGRTPTGTQNLVVIEAENFDANVPQGGKNWVFFSTPVGTGPISGTGYMQALPDTGAAINEPGHLTTCPRMDYCINFPVAGRWYVWLRGNDVTGGANSVHVGIDNTDHPDPNDNRIGNSGGATGWGNPGGATSPWQWTRDADVNTRVAWVTVPTPGAHTFNIWMREDSVLVDKLLLTTDSAFVLAPNTILGPVENPRGDATPQAQVAITRDGGDVTISWNVPAGLSRLQQADDITGQWTDVSNAEPSGYTVPANAAKKFYRVAVP